MIDQRKLSKEQLRALTTAARRAEPVALSAISLLEISLLVSGGKLRLSTSLDEFFADIESRPVFRLLPLTRQVAADLATLPHLQDPADRVIVATARVHNLTLVTSDLRIIESKVVALIS